MNSYKKGQTIWHAGDEVRALGFLYKGAAQVISIDRDGKRSIHAAIKSGEPFGGAFVCAQVHSIPHSVIAVEASKVLFLDHRAIIDTCSKACAAHRKLIENLIVGLAEETLSLKHKLRIIGKHSTREKLMAYLEDEAERCGSNSITVPFKRQELADYLGVERSALSAEISKMRDEGILESERCHFVLLK
ncbi:MAG: Crp/Fnr family transcriptional regulator [Coriobacteriia bacterium]|nr:Crp/Fnr family transcriptional regulator [Coriobacteriia bacterium]